MSPSFFRLLGIGALQSAARWLELLALGVYVFDVTQSPLLVAMITLVKIAPLGLCGPVIGALPARIPGRTLYLAALTMAFVTSLLSAVLAWFGLLSIWLILLVSLIGGVFWAFDFPVRRALIGDAVLEHKLGKAMSLDMIANNGTRMLGPLLGGLLLQYSGLHGALAFCAVCYFVCGYLAYRLDVGQAVVSGSSVTSVIANIAEGLCIVRRNPVLFATLMLTVIYNLFGFPMLSLVPVLGRDELQLSATAIGLLVSLEGAGALLGGLLVFRFGKVHMYRKTYVFGIAAGLVFGFFFARAASPAVAGGLLLLVGIGSACFAAMQTTLLILNSESRYRSQIFGLLSLSIGTGLLGFAQIGLTASWLGTRTALTLSASCGLVVLVLFCLRWPQIVAPQPDAAAGPPAKA